MLDRQHRLAPVPGRSDRSHSRPAHLHSGASTLALVLAGGLDPGDLSPSQPAIHVVRLGAGGGLPPLSVEPARAVYTVLDLGGGSLLLAGAVAARCLGKSWAPPGKGVHGPPDRARCCWSATEVDAARLRLSDGCRALLSPTHNTPLHDAECHFHALPSPTTQGRALT